MQHNLCYEYAELQIDTYPKLYLLTTCWKIRHEKHIFSYITLAASTNAHLNEYIKSLTDYKKSDERAKMMSAYVGKVNKNVEGLMTSYQGIQAKEKQVNKLYSLMTGLQPE